MIYWIISTIDSIFFILIALSVIYLLIFAIASLRKRRENGKEKKKEIEVPVNHNFAIIFPAYKEDKVIKSSVQSALDQQYPRELFDVIVISDKMEDETNASLAEMPIKLLKVNFENSSKAKALKFAVEQLKGNKYDTVVILDADNTVEPDFLSQINKARAKGHIAIQAHRRAKNLNTSTAILDAASEEINNSIFRAGHVRLGFSSALIGSGMAFDYSWFEENIKQVFTAGEDKELEALLLKQHIYVEYLDDVYVYDEKIQKEEAFKFQRRRWLAAQIHTLIHMWKYLPQAIREKNWDYCDKTYQMTILPRIINLVIIPFFAILISFYDLTFSIKWWVLWLILLLVLYIAIPDFLKTKELYKSIPKIPILGIIMLCNLFHLKGASKKFIHTNHG